LSVENVSIFINEPPHTALIVVSRESVINHFNGGICMGMDPYINARMINGDGTAIFAMYMGLRVGRPYRPNYWFGQLLGG
jgi:hypothetical protein